jgi:hypothetical protein
MTEPTPRTDDWEWETDDGIKVVTSDRVRIIERDLARKEALLRDAHALIKKLQDERPASYYGWRAPTERECEQVIKRIERELEGK